ncbi:MAG: translesion error-prone DNA polymerase V autoproteolytic subunit [Chlamydiae bacterium]|nr:translesion error-prone DNA polymerase V autoproteolytic subunit [Chlamydiota bacterium]
MKDHRKTSKDRKHNLQTHSETFAARLDLNQELIAHPAATFFVRVATDSMQSSSIFPEDILIVDRALEAKNGDIVIAVIEGEFLVRRLKKQKGAIFLLSEGEQPIALKSQGDWQIWGVVTYVIHKLKAKV